MFALLLAVGIFLADRDADWGVFNADRTIRARAHSTFFALIGFEDSSIELCYMATEPRSCGYVPWPGLQEVLRWEDGDIIVLADGHEESLDLKYSSIGR